MDVCVCVCVALRYVSKGQHPASDNLAAKLCTPVTQTLRH
jgi:hypothetical protein